MEFITNLDDRETNSRLRRMIRHVDEDAETAVQRIRSEGIEDAISVRNALLTRGYRKVDKWYEAKVHSILKTSDT